MDRLPVSQLMTRNVFALRPDDDLATLHDLMTDRGPSTSRPICHVVSGIVARTASASSAPHTTTMPMPMLSVRYS